MQALGGAAADVPKLATAASNLRTADAILILRANSKNESEALEALHNVSARNAESDTRGAFGCSASVPLMLVPKARVWCGAAEPAMWPCKTISRRCMVTSASRGCLQRAWRASSCPLNPFPHDPQRPCNLPNVQATVALDKLIKVVPKYQAYVSFMDTDVVALTNW